MAYFNHIEYLRRMAVGTPRDAAAVRRDITVLQSCLALRKRSIDPIRRTEGVDEMSATIGVYTQELASLEGRPQEITR